MLTNFDYLKNESKFSAFADIAISAEKVILMDPEASIINSRRAMEFAIKWMYSVDKALELPYKDNLQNLMGSEGISSDCRAGYLEANGVYPPMRKQCGACWKTVWTGRGHVMPGKLVCVSGFCGTLL